MVHQPTDGSQCPGSIVEIKNTFIHITAPPPEPEELKRGRTAPPQVHEESVEVNMIREPEAEPAAEPLNLLPDSGDVIFRLPDFSPAMNGTEMIVAPPCPDVLCRHTTHDVFENGGIWPYHCQEDVGLVEGQEGMAFNANYDGHGNQGQMDYLQGVQGVQGAWEGQVEGQGVQTAEVMHPAPGTAVFVLHPPPCMAPDGFGSPQSYLVPVHINPMGMSPDNLDWRMQAMQSPNWSADSPPAELPFAPVVPMHNSFFPEAGDQSEAANQSAFTTFRKEDLLPERDENPVPLALSEHDKFWDGLGVDLIHQPQKIGRSPTMEHVYWVVDANKLNDKAKVLVSPEFKVVSESSLPLSFKMVMYPKDRTSFRQANGQGFVQLKCESDTQDLKECSLSFRLAICNGRSGDQAKRDGPGKPVTWDFKRSLVCDDDEVKKIWNFKDVVDKETRTFAVCIEILSAVASKP